MGRVDKVKLVTAFVTERPETPSSIGVDESYFESKTTKQTKIENRDRKSLGISTHRTMSAHLVMVDAV